MGQEQSKNTGIKASVQKLGSYLSSMVMPNIGAFIAWGIITALFMADGWLPNEQLSSLIEPMQVYLLPLLIGYTGGKLVYEKTGGVIGAIATMGVIVGSDVPMFIGAMIMGPLAGWLIKKFDDYFSDKIPSGFEMLVNNFSVGIIGFLLAIAGFYTIGPIVTGFTNILAQGVAWIVARGLLPLANIFIEPAKILFLNNAINHGILTPLGTQQVAEMGRSVLFLLEANPGPGLGVLGAFMFFGKGSAKSSSPGAMIIHFLGGIHEIYFPYVLMKPLMFLAVIAGGVSGTFIFQLFGAGLSGASSPGSIIAILGMASPGSHIGVILGVLVSAAVSFGVGVLVLKFDRSGNEEDLESAQASIQASKAESKGQDSDGEETTSTPAEGAPNPENIDNIIFACDAGMGSSAMGASLLRKKAQKQGFDMSITNSSINNLKDSGNTLVITQEELTNRAKKQAPSSSHVSVGNFLDSDSYDRLLADMQNKAVEEVEKENEEITGGHDDVISYDNVQTILVAYEDKVPASAMGASILRNKTRESDRNFDIKAVQLSDLTDDEQSLVITTESLAEKAKEQVPNAKHLVIDELYDENQYQALIEKLINEE